MPETFRIETEDFALRQNVSVRGGQSFASGDGYVQSRGGIGAIQTLFAGESGRYQVVVHYFDESDGTGGVHLNVDGRGRTFWLDDQLGDSRPSDRNADSVVTHDEIRIDKGDPITLFMAARGGENAAVDYIEFRSLDAPEPTPAPSPSAPVPAPIPAAGAPGAFEAEVLALTNAIRNEAGLEPLRWNVDLADAAEAHSVDMAENDYFSHRSRDGSSVGDRVRDEGYQWSRVAENIAAGQDTPEEVVDAWMNSSGHRANILNPAYEEIGIGWHEEAGDRYGDYWTQVFATESAYA